MLLRDRQHRGFGLDGELRRDRAQPLDLALISWAWQKRDRGGKARLDYTQNAINKTLVAPFSTRPAPGAPVSVPIRWEELDDPELAPDRWTVSDVFDRLEVHGDPLAELIGLQQKLPEIH